MDDSGIFRLAISLISETLSKQQFEEFVRRVNDNPDGFIQFLSGLKSETPSHFDIKSKILKIVEDCEKEILSSSLLLEDGPVILRCFNEIKNTLYKDPSEKSIILNKSLDILQEKLYGHSATTLANCADPYYPGSRKVIVDLAEHVIELRSYIIQNQMKSTVD